MALLRGFLVVTAGEARAAKTIVTACNNKTAPPTKQIFQLYLMALY